MMPLRCCFYLPRKPTMRVDFRHCHAMFGFESEHAANQSYTKRFGRHYVEGGFNVHSASVLKLVHGTSLNISPERYLQNSGLLSVGSSHGVSTQELTVSQHQGHATHTPSEKGEQDDTHAPYVNRLCLIRCSVVQLSLY